MHYQEVTGQNPGTRGANSVALNGYAMIARYYPSGTRRQFFKQR